MPCGFALGQTSDIAARIYREASPSVFVIIVHDAKGSPLSLGTGFLVRKNTLATNLHVVEGGSVSVQVGPVSIPATVEKRDPKNDLAIVHVKADISAVPLVLSKASPVPGENVVVIGNPEGLEKSVSTGIVAGVRQTKGRTLLQITAPISHGSSGGPVLNSDGEVIGVSVGMITEGENLNFAVPAKQVRALLIAGTRVASQGDVLSLLSQAGSVSKEQSGQKYSSDPNSDWQKSSREIDSLFELALEEAGKNPRLLLEIAKQGKLESNSIAITAAKRALAVRPSAEGELLLAKALSLRAILTSLANGKPATTWAAAERAYRAAIRLSGKPTSDMYGGLALALEDVGSYGDAKTAYDQELKSATVKDSGGALRGLVRISIDLKQPGIAESWFQVLVDRHLAEAGDYEEEARRLDRAQKWVEAGNDYATAALSGGAWTDWCQAANSFWGTSKSDDALSDARECIERGAGKEKSGVYLSMAHRIIADVLNTRGVYSEALNHAREAVNLNSTNPWNFQILAKVLYSLRRFEEAINASKQAIRLSDGKYAAMHFLLGNSYFELQEWPFAEQSFELAAQMNPTDTAAPYNVALCMVHLGDRADAAEWYQEVLRRNPNYPDAAEIRSRIAILRGEVR